MLAIKFVLDGLIIIGALILCASLVTINRLTAQLPPGRMRHNWQLARTLIIAFICGYVCYVAANWIGGLGNAPGLSHYIVPIVFLFGACFIYIVTKFALETVVNIRRVAALEIENITDPLMGIHNRRYLDFRLKEEVKRSERYRLPLSVLLMDIDHFKRINDRHGHQVGDSVLAGLGKLLLETVRTTDIVARYGGDEIMIIATNTPLSNAPVLAQRLRKAVEDWIQVPPGEASGKGKMVRVTVSIGVAGFGAGADSVDAIVKSADDALHEAKAKGRNIVIANTPQPVVA